MRATIHNVPSLYVRVYRPRRKVCCMYRSSLTIREGISQVRTDCRNLETFPHYTWGYIAEKPGASWYLWVPSLYVRVYRLFSVIISASRCSLTIREGISDFFSAIIDQQTFPHYTWGYIERLRTAAEQLQVPSLYVRVYRKQFVFWYTSRSSLTIREGISMLSASKTDRQKFPHYTWGYIGVSYLNPGEMQVPSLYVRVYRNNADMITACRCSLTIREGISNGNRERFKGYAFPHYTWGYIAALRYRSRPVRVPSLYVRVYRS